MPLPNNWTLDDVLALSLHPHTKARDTRALVERYSSLETLLQNAPDALSKARATNGSLFAAEQVDELRRNAAEQRELCAKNGVQTISFWDEEYPALLKEIYYPPTFLFVRGRLQAPDAAAIAIVGTRHCTDYGKMVAEQYAEFCARAGVVVVSGMATGIDAFAHKAVVKSGGVTYAVIASGIDKISSSAARRLADEICERGAVVSEYPMGTPAMPAYFPRRNRIISGIAQGTLVVQSGEKGGSLITAQFAIDQNRELFAAPGGIYSERSKGSNRLIQRSQAHLTLTPEDMFQTLGFATNAASKTAAYDDGDGAELSGVEAGVYKELADSDPVHIEALALKTGLASQDLLVILLQLEFKGKIRQLAGKQFMKRV